MGPHALTALKLLVQRQHVVTDDIRIENNICDAAPMETDEQEDDSIVWTVVEVESRRRHPKLTSSSGYSYNV